MDTTPDAQPAVQQPEVEAELTNEEALRLVLRDAVHSGLDEQNRRAKALHRRDLTIAKIRREWNGGHRGRL